MVGPLYRAVRALEHTIDDDLGATLRSLQEGQQIVVQQRQSFAHLDNGYETRDLLQRLENSLRDFRKTAESVREEQAKKREDRRKQRGEDDSMAEIFGEDQLLYASDIPHR